MSALCDAECPKLLSVNTECHAYCESRGYCCNANGQCDAAVMVHSKFSILF